jgi:hypothetical protein
MNKKRIFCFGDSWVEGVGTEMAPGSGKISVTDRYRGDYWKSTYHIYAWPGQLRSMFDGDVIVNNYGRAGCSNNDIYVDIIKNIWNGIIKNGDFVIVSLSSIIRQNLPFLFVRDDVYGYIHYSNSSHLQYKRGFQDDKLHWIETIDDTILKKITHDVYMDYIVNRFNYDFLYEISMNYICNLQIYFEKLGINYAFVNAFENNLSKSVSFYGEIKKDKWVLFDYTLQEYLLDKAKDFDISNGYSLWEDDTINVEKNQDGPHPNRIGHKMIAELIYNTLFKNE